MTAGTRKPASDVLARLKEAVGPKGFLAEPADMAPFLVELRDLYRGATPLVVMPATTEEVARVVSICAESGTGIVPQGGNTGLVGGQIPQGEILLSLKRMNRIRSVDPLSDTITAEAGAILADVQARAAEADRLFPLSLGAEGSCTIGGNIATNAGGTNVLRYGTARDLVLGLEVVLPDGRVFDGLKSVRKDNTGYDLKQLFIGAEGTLGVITAAVLKLFPRPRAQAAAFLGLAEVESTTALLALARALSGEEVTAFELISRRGLDFVLKHVPGARDPLSGRHAWYVLIELSSSEASEGVHARLERVLEEGMARNLLQDAAIAESEAQRLGLWRLRESLPEVQKREGGSIKCDIAVPVACVPAFIKRATAEVEARLPGIRPVPFGHVGDGNVHFNLSQPDGMDKAAFLARWEEIAGLVHAVALTLGGSISAEHGVGVMRRDEIARVKDKTALDLMRALKHALDPKGIMNPGKVIL
jgi:FAD/FMN-containing dehydrogenase